MDLELVLVPFASDSETRVDELTAATREGSAAKVLWKGLGFRV